MFAFRKKVEAAGLTLAALVVAAALIAWLGGGTLVRRAQSAQLPALPDAAALPAAVRPDLMAADTGARAHPRSAEAVGDLGMAYHASLLPAQARQAYVIAGQLAPSDARWPYYVGLLHEERGEQEAALDAFTRVTKLEPGFGLAWFHVAEIAFKADRVEAARLAYERARDAPAPPPFLIGGGVPRQAMPLFVYAELGLARISIERGDASSAISRLESLLRGQPRFGVARTLLSQLRGDEASTAGDRSPVAARAYVPPADPLLDALVARSRHTDLLLKHVALAARGGDQAWREFLVRRALEANPSGLDVLLEMASTLQALGRHAEAIEYLKQCERVAPGDHHMLVEHGKSLSELGRLEEAEQVLRRAVRVRDAAAEYNLGTGTRPAGPLGRSTRALRARPRDRSVPYAGDEQPGSGAGPAWSDRCGSRPVCPRAACVA